MNSVLLKGAFKTPGLRNVARTAPYFHRGQFESLEQVVRFYSDGAGRSGSVVKASGKIFIATSRPSFMSRAR